MARKWIRQGSLDILDLTGSPPPQPKPGEAGSSSNPIPLDSPARTPKKARNAAAREVPTAVAMPFHQSHGRKAVAEEPVPRVVPPAEKPQKKNNADVPPEGPSNAQKSSLAAAIPTARKRKSVGEEPAASVPPPAKKQRKKKDPEAPQEEKRGAIMKKSCPKNILDRVDRVASQRFFMVERKRNGEELREEFGVLGSTGNVYKVVIDKKPSCDCPDARKGNHCKHILFIFMKVLQVPYQSNVWYQKALLTSELQTIFANAPEAPNSVTNQRVREAYARATGKASGSSSSNTNETNKRLPGPEDDCPICYENMHKVDVKKMAFCDTCKNGLHLECFQQWARTAGRNVTCVFCRAEWAIPGPSGGDKATRGADGYLNLASAAGLSPVRDTSTYYQGPRRGSRYYGYQEYEDFY
ncbi:hypothetical protein JAAARDRAFT_32263 [Jaapia argillacea MUCL 33604]|uniref:SWIM-type domain-containing protein n=1 Tax=Jaapia argillacea MUCL 33604 TaxID=933084 RepID=A0A067QF78_9AGAM|nr:hypothetical protein JAAARDRAFT_32263 [Jaapia argillacea MUCL 33604]